MEPKLDNEQVLRLKNSSNESFFVRKYLPATGKPMGILQVIHGMAEHSGRYSEFGEYLAKNGFGLYASDLPGHGQTAENHDKLGYLSGVDGWEKILENTRALYTHIRTSHSEVPVFILGHSLGSVLAKHFTAIYPVYIQGLILSGTFDVPEFKMRLLNVFLNLQSFLAGTDKKSKWFNRLFFGGFNKHFKPRITPYEWISSNRYEVDLYANDPYCGFDCSIGFFKSFGRGYVAMKKASHSLTYRKTLPMLIFCGQDDPVGNFGKDAIKIHRDFYKQRFRNLTLKVFHGRHEMLHEKDKSKVFEYLLNWLLEHLHTR
ncbi:MAG TPA: alpha/beta fold hydrolase [Bacteroidales bacterium]|nr:alpha/beta fold hydrolase [Bacteroidales bacterium]